MVASISTGGIFIAHALSVLVRPMDFKPPITITIKIHATHILLILFPLYFRLYCPRAPPVRCPAPSTNIAPTRDTGKGEMGEKML
jgi:hypothetical protein